MDVAAPPAPAVVAAPPAPAAAGGAAAGRRDQVQLGMAVAAAAFALFASRLHWLQLATFPNLPAHCVTTDADAVSLSYPAAVVLLYVAALLHVPPSRIGSFLAYFADALRNLMLGHLFVLVVRVLFAVGRCLASAINALGIVTLGHLFLLVVTLVFATGAICSRSRVDLRFAAIFAATFFSVEGMIHPYVRTLL